MARVNIPTKTETEILTRSKRKCSLCVGLDGNYSVKKGQIAHLDRINSNNNSDNLCWLCFDHHSEYDSTTSQHKNYTIKEVKQYRNQLYIDLAKKDYDSIDSSLTPSWKPYSLMFNGIDAFLSTDFDIIERKQKIIIETTFKIHNEYYAGVLLNLINTTQKEFLYFIHYSSQHPSKPNSFELHYKVGNNVPQILFSFKVKVTDWTTLLLNINEESISLSINNTEVKLYDGHLPIAFNKIEIGGTTWENQEYSDQLPKPNFLTSYFGNMTILKGHDLLENLEFSYGFDYFKSAVIIPNYKLYGGCKFIDN